MTTPAGRSSFPQQLYKFEFEALMGSLHTVTIIHQKPGAKTIGLPVFFVRLDEGENLDKRTHF